MYNGRWLPQKEYEQKLREDAASVVIGGVAIAAMVALFYRGKPPAHWGFLPYLLKFTLSIAVPMGLLGALMAFATRGWEGEYAAESLQAAGPLGSVAIGFIGLGGIGQVIALVVAVTVYLAGMSQRKMWADQRKAGWTTKQCLTAWQYHQAKAKQQRADEKAHRMAVEHQRSEARQHELQAQQQEVQAWHDSGRPPVR